MARDRLVPFDEGTSLVLFMELPLMPQVSLVVRVYDPDYGLTGYSNWLTAPFASGFDHRMGVSLMRWDLESDDISNYWRSYRSRSWSQNG